MALTLRLKRNFVYTYITLKIVSGNGSKYLLMMFAYVGFGQLVSGSG